MCVPLTHFSFQRAQLDAVDGALVISRYSHQIVNEKLEIRRQLMELGAAPYSSIRPLKANVGAPAPRGGTHYRELSNTSEANVGLLTPRAGTHYRDLSVPHEPQPEVGLPVYAAVSEGYGGGQWSLQQASEDEKRRMREAGDMDDSHE